MSKSFHRKSRHVRSIQNPSQQEEKQPQPQEQHFQPQESAQSSSKHPHNSEGNFRCPPALRGDRRGHSLCRRFNQNTQQQRMYCIFYRENKGHTTKFCQTTIQKQKELAAIGQNIRLKEVYNTTFHYPSPYVPQHIQYKNRRCSLQHLLLPFIHSLVVGVPTNNISQALPHINNHPSANLST